MDFEEYIRQGEPSRAERAQAWRTAREDTGIYKFAGRIRDYNITKKEWVLDGGTVIYAGAGLITETLEYDITAERDFSYEGLTADEAVRHLLLNEEADLRNRTLHIKADGLKVRNEPLKSNLKAQNEPLNNLTGKATLTEIAVLQVIAENPSVKIEEMAANTKKSRSTIKRAIDRLREKGVIERTGAKKNGSWKILNGNEH